MSPTGSSPPIPHGHAIKIWIALLACAPVATLAGCRSHAHNDLYRQKMASEIRTLEDQLYEADYRNRVLQDKLHRLKQSEADLATQERQPAAESARPPDRPLPDRPLPDRQATPPAVDLDVNVDDDDDPLQLPQVDDGVPTDFLDLPGAGSEGDAEAAKRRQPDVDPERDEPRLVPPSAPEPPGREDLDLPDVFPGEQLPPNGDNSEEMPPGQIQLPDSIQAGSDAPQSIQIHRGLSGGHQFDEDDSVDGIYVVVNAVDSLGKIVDLDAFEIDAELSVVVLDPERTPAEAKVGRWDFSPAEVKDLIRDRPTSGLFIPIRWSDGRIPQSDEVTVHVRLRADEDEMRCHDNLIVGAAAATARWTPRGD